MTIDEKMCEIKRQFRLAMNGIVSSSMREKGIDYRVNFGLTLPLLNRIAASHTPDKELAERLWNESVRESKMLATRLYPPQEMDIDTARRWVAEIPYTEIADQCCMHLFPHIAQASTVATECLDSNNDMTRYTGCRLWCRLLQQGHKPSPQEQEKIVVACRDFIDNGDTPASGAAALRMGELLLEKYPDTAAQILSDPILGEIFKDFID